MGSVTEIIPQAKPDDKEIVSRILNGERDLYRLLAERYAERIMRMVRRLVPTKEDAEEVTQDALLEAFKSLSRFDRKQSGLQTWLMRIAYNMALRHYRQSQKTVPIANAKQEWLENMSDDEADEILSDTSSDRLSLLGQATDQLKPDDQMLLSFYYYDDYSIKDISQITGRDGGYLRSRLQWIRKKLAVIIKQLENHERQ